MNILIVDDDEIARLSLAGILAPLGRVEQAGDGEQAWEMLERGLRPDVCCCDLSMPRLDGLSLVRRARGHAVLGDLRFVMISAVSDRRTVETAIRWGISGYIVKPFHAAQTRAAVERVLQAPRPGDAEHAMQTRRRLEVDAEQLRVLLSTLRQDVDTCRNALEDVAAGRAALQRLHGGALVLGLWRATALLKDLLTRPHEPARARLVLDEVASLVERQSGDPDLAGAPGAAWAP